MSHKILTVTFTDDLPQFRMFCYCLAKNWQGQRSLIVALGQGTNEDHVRNLLDSVFDSSWQTEIKSSVVPTVDGSTEQQINKIYFSVQSAVDDVIVFDSKDFLLRPCDFSVFKKSNDRYRVTYKLVGKKLVDMGYDVNNIVDSDIDHLPAVSNLTPWIWNVAQLTKYWEHLNQKFGDFRCWENFPAGNEIYGYYVYTWTDKNRHIKFLTHPDMPLLIAGGWTHQTYQGMCEQMQEFEQDTNRLIWKHSRKLRDPLCKQVTKQVLEKNGIPSDQIDLFMASDLVPT